MVIVLSSAKQPLPPRFQTSISIIIMGHTFVKCSCCDERLSLSKQVTFYWCLILYVLLSSNSRRGDVELPRRGTVGYRQKSQKSQPIKSSLRFVRLTLLLSAFNGSGSCDNEDFGREEGIPAGSYF
eukprot:scaffold42990_cov56-Attheya_sp.AAC.2